MNDARHFFFPPWQVILKRARASKRTWHYSQTSHALVQTISFAKARIRKQVMQRSNLRKDKNQDHENFSSHMNGANTSRALSHFRCGKVQKTEREKHNIQFPRKPNAWTKRTKFHARARGFTSSHIFSGPKVTCHLSTQLLSFSLSFS